MNYGDEYCVEITPGFDPNIASAAQLSKLFKNANRLSWFHASPNQSFTQASQVMVGRSLCYKIDEDCLLEINDSLERTPLIVRNEVSDLISFQFVSTVKRSEFLGDRRNVHDLGPAIIVSAIPNQETTYRVPKINEPIRHVMVHTTLSNLMERMGETRADYPRWLQEILDGTVGRPRQRALFLDEIHRDLTWPCFNLPVSGTLLPHWLSSKFKELLCVGLQILKSHQTSIDDLPARPPFRSEDKLRRARTILNSEYANPPTLPALAKILGISETQLKSGFKSMTGTTVLQYCIARRIDAARLLLNENRYSISEIADIVGYQDHSAFSRAFYRLSGCSPREWRQRKNS